DWMTIQPSLSDKAPPYGHDVSRADIFLPTRSASLQESPLVVSLTYDLSALLNGTDSAGRKPEPDSVACFNTSPSTFLPHPLDRPCPVSPPVTPTLATRTTPSHKILARVPSACHRVGVSITVYV